MGQRQTKVNVYMKLTVEG